MEQSNNQRMLLFIFIELSSIYKACFNVSGSRMDRQAPSRLHWNDVNEGTGPVVSTNTVLIWHFVVGAYVHVHLTAYHKISTHTWANSAKADFNGCILTYNDHMWHDKQNCTSNEQRVAVFDKSFSAHGSRSLILGPFIEIAGIRPEGEHLRQVSEPSVRIFLSPCPQERTSNAHSIWNFKIKLRAFMEVGPGVLLLKAV